MVVPQSNKREQVLKLIEEKEKMEVKINELGNILRAVIYLKLFLLQKIQIFFHFRIMLA